jgi:hypothetical protein
MENRTYKENVSPGFYVSPVVKCTIAMAAKNLSHLHCHVPKGWPIHFSYYLHSHFHPRYSVISLSKLLLSLISYDKMQNSPSSQTLHVIQRQNGLHF